MVAMDFLQQVPLPLREVLERSRMEGAPKDGAVEERLNCS